MILSLLRDVEVTDECDALHELGSGISVKPRVWSTFLDGNIGPNPGMDRGKGNDASYTISKLSTRRINPDMEAVRPLFEEHEVQAAIKDSRFRANLYLIDGIQIAHGAEYKLGKTRELGANFDLSADLTPAGAPATTVGVALEAKKTSSATSAGYITSDFVFAYTLRAITYRRKRVERQTRTSGGDLMSNDERRRRGPAYTPENGHDDQAEFLSLREDNPDIPEYWDLESGTWWTGRNYHVRPYIPDIFPVESDCSDCPLICIATIYAHR